MTTNETHFAVPKKILQFAANLRPSSITVYLGLAAMKRPAAETICVSSAALGRATGIGQRSVFAAIAELTRVGLINRLKGSQTGIGRYFLITDEPRADEENQQTAGGEALRNCQEVPVAAPERSNSAQRSSSEGVDERRKAQDCATVPVPLRGNQPTSLPSFVALLANGSAPIPDGYDLRARPRRE